MLTILIPAHNEGGNLSNTLDSIVRQTLQPDEVVVIADNCTDNTADIADQYGMKVFKTRNNTYKKAGALNQWLDTYLATLDNTHRVMVMDADSVLAPDFISNAYKYFAKGYAAVGGVFTGKPGGGFVGMLQRNEYARYARDVKRRAGKTLVLTGTATIFTTESLKEIVNGRKTGRIPGTGTVPQVYDTKALTEDNELTFAYLHMGHKIIAPADCQLTTEVMETWRELHKQRLRWKRGAIENNKHYGLTCVTAKYWGLQIWGTIGILATTIYLLTVAYAAIFSELNFMWVWMFVTAIYILERAVTVHKRGWKQTILAALLVIEMPYDIVLQYVHAQAITEAVFGTKKNW